MKVVEKNKPFEVEFDDLSIGDVFKYHFLCQEEKCVLMKIGDGMVEFNAVDLATGETCGIAGEGLCEPVEAELVIFPKQG